MTDKSELCKHSGSCVKNAINGFIRGMVIACGIKVVIKLIGSLLNLSVFKNPAAILGKFSKNDIRLVLLLSGMVGINRSALCFLRRITKSEKISSFCAGFISGIPMVFESSENRVLYSLYALTRALDILVKFLVHKNVIPAIPFAIEIIYIAALAPLIYAKGFNPESLNKGILSLTNKLHKYPLDDIQFDMVGFGKGIKKV